MEKQVDLRVEGAKWLKAFANYYRSLSMRVAISQVYEDFFSAEDEYFDNKMLLICNRILEHHKTLNKYLHHGRKGLTTLEYSQLCQKMTYLAPYIDSREDAVIKEAKEFA